MKTIEEAKRAIKLGSDRNTLIGQACLICHADRVHNDEHWNG